MINRLNAAASINKEPVAFKLGFGCKLGAVAL